MTGVAWWSKICCHFGSRIHADMHTCMNTSLDIYVLCHTIPYYVHNAYSWQRLAKWGLANFLHFLSLSLDCTKLHQSCALCMNHHLQHKNQYLLFVTILFFVIYFSGIVLNPCLFEIILIVLWKLNGCGKYIF